jgi:hypothetical protein
MEQLVMLLVFALAAALCVQVFVLSDETSRQNETRDRAVVAAQNAAETLKSCRGDYAAAAQRAGGSWDGACWSLAYDDQWELLPGGTDGLAAYYAQVTAENSDTPLMGEAEAAVYDADGTCLFRLSIAWQEVTDRG